MAIIKFKRGLVADIPPLAEGEPGFCTDTKELFVGSSDGNILVGEGTFLKLTGGVLTGALSLPPEPPTQPNHAANKAYVDNVASGLDVKASVKCVATVNQPLEMVEDDHSAYVYINETPVTIDGYTIGEDDRILLVGQNNQLQNGIFVVKAGDGSEPCMLARPEDATNGTLTGGAFVFVEQGTTYGDTGWVCTTDDDPLVIGDNLIEFTQFTGAGSSSFISLADTPSSYSSEGGKVVRVNAGADGLEFVDPTLLGRVNFIELDDTPASYEASRVPAVNTAGDELVWVTKESLGIQKIENFEDFAGSYLSNGGKMLRVDADESKLEYFSPDTTPNAQNEDIPISSRWAAGHQSASNDVHGAPAGVNLLHENSVIDGGTFV